MEELLKLLQLKKATEASQVTQPMGLLGNTEALIATGLLSQGAAGKNIFEAALPSLTQAAQIRKLVQPKKTSNFVQLTPEQKKARGLPMDKEFQLDTSTNKVSQIGGSQVTVNMGKELSQGLSVTNQYQKESDTFIQRNSSRQQILALTEKNKKRTPQEDFDLVYAYYKYLDPGSTVRETEFENLEKLGSVGRKIAKIIPKYTKGRILSDEQVQEIKNSMEKQFSSFAEEQKSRFDRYSTLLKENKLNPNLYLQDYLAKPKTPVDLKNLSMEELKLLLNRLPK